MITEPIPKDMQGMGIGTKIFSTAVEGETSFEAQWVQSTKLYGETGASKNLIQYNNAIQKEQARPKQHGVHGLEVRQKRMDLIMLLCSQCKMA